MISNLSVRAAALILFASPLPVFACSGGLHIELAQAGVYALDHAAVAAAQPGLADCAVDDLVLTQNGREVPLRVVARGTRFADGDRLEWIGEPLHGPESWFDPYSVANVYLLGASPGAHARLRDAPAASASGAPARLERSLHLEQENLMIRLDQAQQKPGEEPDVWQWAKLTQVDPQPFTTSIDLPDLATRDAHANVRLTLAFRGLSTVAAPATAKDKPDDHVVEVELNGHALAPLAWNGRDDARRDIDVPAALLKAHGNTLSLRVPVRRLPWPPQATAIDVVMVNWIEARYPLSGNLDGASLPLRATTAAPIELASSGAAAPVLYGSDGLRREGRALGRDRYAFAPASAGVVLYPATSGARAKPLALRATRGSQWQDPEQGYDYLIVAHPSLIDAVRPLAAFHEKRGLRVAVLDTDEVYDQFNHGIVHPRAIRNLVDTAWHHWPRKPRYLLLVGDASFDIRHDTYNDLNYAKWTNAELLFPNHFGAVPGESYADKPARLADRNLIPTWQFPSPEGQSASDNWFGAVDGDDWHPVVAVGRFPVVRPDEVSAIVDKTIDYLSKPQLGQWRRDVMFIADETSTFKQASDEIAGTLGRQGFLADKVYASPAESDNAAHQNAIHAGIDAGRLLVHFIGHGGRYIWRTGPPDLHNNNDLFTLEDVSRLGNGARLPMVLSMTCYSAPFDNPTEDSIGERFLREPGKGAIAVFAASWRNSPSPAFSKRLIGDLLAPGATIGDAIVAAKKAERDRTLVEMYNLLGDPAVVLERPRDHARLADDGTPTQRGVLVDLGTPHFDGNVHVDWLDDGGRVLAGADYHTGTARFRLPVPQTGKDKVARVRLYAASPASGRDAVGGLDFAAPVAQVPLRQTLAAWWNNLTRKPPPPPAPDTIARRAFDERSAAPSAAVASKATGGSAAAGAAR